VWRCQYTDDGELLVSGSSDNSAIVWDMSDYKPITIFTQHSLAV